MLTSKLLSAVLDKNVSWVGNSVLADKVVYRYFSDKLYAPNAKLDSINIYELIFLLKRWALSVHGHELRTSVKGIIDVYSAGNSEFKIVEGLDYRRTELESVIIYCERLI